MTTFLISYRMPRNFVPGRPGAVGAWMSFFDGMGDGLLDRGNPVFESGTLGNCEARHHPRRLLAGRGGRPRVGSGSGQGVPGAGRRAGASRSGSSPNSTDPADVRPRPATRPRPAAPASPAGPVLSVLLTSVAYFMVTLDALVVVTALPAIHRGLGGGVSTLQWTVSAYTITFGAGILTAAALGDRWGRRRVYVAGLILFTVASAACALAPTAALLIACRAVQGLGAAAVLPLGLTLLTQSFPTERRGAVVGIWGGIAGLAVACGPLVGGALTEELDWHWVFWVNVPIGVGAALGARFRLPESWGPRARLDVPALALVSSGIGRPHLGPRPGRPAGLGQHRERGRPDRRRRCCWWPSCCERGGRDEPMIPLGLFRRRTFSSAVATQFLMSASIFSAAFLISQFFQFALGDTPLGTGLRFLPWTATPLLVAPLAGALSDRVGARTLVVPGLVLQAVGFLWIVGLAGTASGYGRYILPFVIAGTGISMALPCVTAAGLNAVPPALLGKASGTLNTLQQFGAVVGIAVVDRGVRGVGQPGRPCVGDQGLPPVLDRGRRPVAGRSLRRRRARPWPTEPGGAPSQRRRRSAVRRFYVTPAT